MRPAKYKVLESETPPNADNLNQIYKEGYEFISIIKGFNKYGEEKYFSYFKWFAIEYPS